VFVTDDLLLRMLAHALDQVDVAALDAVVHAGPARCVTGWRDPDTWYRTGTPRRDRVVTRPAVVVCRRCEVAVPCGLLAVARRESWGIWGGLSERRRRQLIRLLGQVAGSPATRKPGRPPGSSPALPPIRRRPAPARGSR
jgi:hypothetical protein